MQCDLYMGNIDVNSNIYLIAQKLVFFGENPWNKPNNKLFKNISAVAVIPYEYKCVI